MSDKKNGGQDFAKKEKKDLDGGLKLKELRMVEKNVLAVPMNLIVFIVDGYRFHTGLASDAQRACPCPLLPACHPKRQGPLLPLPPIF